MSKTKNDVLREFYGDDFDNFKRQSGALVFDAMEEYAKQEAIQFAKWCKTNCESSITPNVWYWFRKGTAEIEAEYSTEELYSLYLKNKQP